VRRGGLILLLLAGFLGFYFTGHLDRPLYSVGLNFHECGRNGLGATFCGKELDEYRERINGVKERLATTKANLEATEQKAREESTTREREAGERRTTEHREQEHTLEAKLSRERAIVAAEPNGSAASDLAAAEYEAARAELQQLRVSTEGGG
jgi:hypothetical protein